MKTKKLSFIVAFAIAFVTMIGLFTFTTANPTTAKADGETSTPAVITLGGTSSWCSYLGTDPATSRIQVPVVNCTWDSSFATDKDYGGYVGKVETLQGKEVEAGLIIRKAADGKFRIDFKVPQNDDSKFIVKSNAVFTDTAATGDRPASVKFNANYVITYKVNAAPTLEELGILTPTNMKWSATDTSFLGYVGYASFEYTADGYDPKTENLEIKGVIINVYDLDGNKSSARMDVNFDKKSRVYLRVASDSLTQFVVKKGEVFSLSGKAFKFNDTYKFTWTPTKEGGTAKCEVFDESEFDKPEQPIAEKLVVSIGAGMWATDLAPNNENGRIQLSFASTKEGYYKATGVYEGKAEDDKGNKVDITVEWDSKVENKLVLKFSKKVEILVLKTDMEFTLSEEVSGAPQKVSFAKDVFLTYAIGTNKLSATDLAKLASMKTADVSLGIGSYATDSNPEEASARAFVSFLGCTWSDGETTFTLPSEIDMGKGVKYAGKVYDVDGKEYTTSVELEVTALPEKDRTEESTANKEFRVYVKFAKTINPVVIKAGTVFQRTADDAEGMVTPFKLVIDKDYIVTYILDTDNVRFTPYLVTFEKTEGIYEGSRFYAEDGEKLTAPTEVTIPDGCRLAWVDENDEEFDFENSAVTANLTLHAKVIKQFTVTFDSNGGTKINSQKIDEGGIAKKPNDPLKLSDDEKIKYVLKGWYTEGSETAFDFENTVIAADTTLKAEWETKVVKVSVTYDSVGGTAVETVLVDINGKAVKPADPQKTVDGKNYKFEGWYLEGSETAFDFDTTLTEDITLIAKWTEIKEESPGCLSGISANAAILALCAVAAVAFVLKKKEQ